MEMLRERVADGSLLRLVGKCLHVGVLDGEEFTEPSEGTVQGSTLPPRLARAIQRVYAWCRENRHLPSSSNTHSS